MKIPFRLLEEPEGHSIQLASLFAFRSSRDLVKGQLIGPGNVKHLPVLL